MTMNHLLALGWPGPFEMLLILGLGLLIFGKRLPEVGRSMGKTIIEFKKGMREVEDEMHQVDAPAKPREIDAKPAPKFDPYTGKPLAGVRTNDDSTTTDV